MERPRAKVIFVVFRTQDCARSQTAPTADRSGASVVRVNERISMNKPQSKASGSCLRGILFVIVVTKFVATFYRVVIGIAPAKRMQHV